MMHHSVNIAVSEANHYLPRFTEPGESEAFEGVVADTDFLKAACFRIRHQVYCVERQFMHTEDYPNGLEIDEHDHHSVHGLLRCRRTGIGVGTVRVVLPKSGSNSGGLPMYDLFERDGLNMTQLPPAALTGEISRFAISKEGRRALCEASTGDSRGGLPELALGLMAMAFQICPTRQITYLCAVMEPTLIRLLARFGIRWRAVGPVLDYYGLRQPCMARIDDMMAEIERDRPDVWELMSRRPSIDLDEYADSRLIAA
jgi:N-acyl amino acid synthase of PEP-CTERM/exosortase system